MDEENQVQNPDGETPSADEVDAQVEPMETEESHKEADDGVVDVSGILKDIDDFNRSADPTPPKEPLDGEEPGQSADVDMDAKEASLPPTDEAVEKGQEEAMDTAETTKPVTSHTGEDEVPDTSQAIAALKSLESYDDVDSRESNEPEQFSEDIVDEEKAPGGGDDADKDKDPKEATSEDKEETEPSSGEKETTKESDEVPNSILFSYEVKA